jgi:hypothetical protein
VEDDPSTRRGFERLRNQGFNLQEVAAIRSYFNPQVAAYAARQEAREGEAAAHMSCYFMQPRVVLTIPGACVQSIRGKCRGTALPHGGGVDGAPGGGVRVR